MRSPIEGIASGYEIEQAQDVKPSLLYRGQLIVENEGSTTRDFLAYERNYLAWIKLVITCMVISGTLLTRIQIHDELFGHLPDKPTSLEDRAATPLGILFFIVALLSLIAATTAFFRTQQDILKGLGHITNGLFIDFTSVLATLVIAASCILFLVASEQSDPSPWKT